MPQTTAAAKALRSSARRRLVNSRWRRRVHDAVRNFQQALLTKDKSQVKTALVSVQSVLDRAARHRVVHPTASARTKSRLAAASKAIANQS